MKRKKRTKEKNEKGISIKIDRENSTALLTIKDWHNNKLRKKYNQQFLPEIKRIIKRIESNNIEHLIIDVRNNQGGDPKNSKYLLSYLLQEDFELVEQYEKKKKGEVKKCKGPQLGIHQPLHTTFEGKIYVLINGGSFSNTGIFCSVLKKHNRAIFIGKETGGSEFVICGNPKKLKLPNTGILIQIPHLKFLIKEYKNKQLHGIIPDYEVEPTIENLIKKEDVVLNYTMELVKKTVSNED